MVHRNLNFSAFWRHWQAFTRNNSSIANALKFTFHAYAFTWQILLRILFALKLKTPRRNNTWIRIWIKLKRYIWNSPHMWVTKSFWTKRLVVWPNNECILYNIYINNFNTINSIWYSFDCLWIFTGHNLCCFVFKLRTSLILVCLVAKLDQEIRPSTFSISDQNPDHGKNWFLKLVTSLETFCYPVRVQNKLE